MKKQFLLIILLLILSACDNDKIQPGVSHENALKQTTEFENIVTVEQKEVPGMYEAVGTIRPLTESVIESQINAQVLKVSCVPGTAVKKGQILIELDSRRLTAQLQQAKEGLSVAKKSRIC